MEKTPIHAVIAVWHRGARTFYVRRSARMANYPLVWSPLSIQFDPKQVDPLDLAQVQPLMDRMGRERLCGARVRVTSHLSSASCAENPMERRVFLHLYEVELDVEPTLDSAFYSDAAWLEPPEYQQRAAGATCGLCTRRSDRGSLRSRQPGLPLGRRRHNRPQAASELPRGRRSARSPERPLRRLPNSATRPRRSVGLNR
jgi:hypothetical protein